MGQQEENIYADFQKQLEQIGDAILEGTVILDGIRENEQGSFKEQTKCLGDLFEKILIERELYDYAGQKFYKAKGLKCINDDCFDAAEEQNKPSGVEWLFFRSIPDTVSLLQALFIDWKTDQSSDKNAELSKKWGIGYATHPGPQKKQNKPVQNNEEKLEEKWKGKLKPFDKMRGEYPKYFPAFFVLAMLGLEKDEIRFLGKLTQLDPHSYCKTKKENEGNLKTLCEKIRNLGNGKKPLSHSEVRQKSKLMREYIAMVAFLALLNEIRDDQIVINNIVCLEKVTGLCSALFSEEAIQLIQSEKLNWRECLCNGFIGIDDNIPQDKPMNVFYYTLEKKPDPIISKIMFNGGDYYVNRVSQRTENYFQLESKNISLQEKLNKLTSWQFYNIDFEYGGDKEFEAIRDAYKRKTLNVYFAFRKNLEKNPEMHKKTWKGLVRIYIAILRDFIQECDGDYEQKGRVVMFPKRQQLMDNYKTMIEGWCCFFIVRRNQNGEDGEILKAVNKNFLKYRFFLRFENRLNGIASWEDEDEDKPKKKKDRRTEKVKK